MNTIGLNISHFVKHKEVLFAKISNKINIFLLIFIRIACVAGIFFVGATITQAQEKSVTISFGTTINVESEFDACSSCNEPNGQGVILKFNRNKYFAVEIAVLSGEVSLNNGSQETYSFNESYLGILLQNELPSYEEGVFRMYGGIGFGTFNFTNYKNLTAGDGGYLSLGGEYIFSNGFTLGLNVRYLFAQSEAQSNCDSFNDAFVMGTCFTGKHDGYRLTRTLLTLGYNWGL